MSLVSSDINRLLRFKRVQLIIKVDLKSIPSRLKVVQKSFTQYPDYREDIGFLYPGIIRKSIQRRAPPKKFCI